MLVFGNDRYMHKITEMTAGIDTFTIGSITLSDGYEMYDE